LNFISFAYGIYSISKAFSLYGFWTILLIPLWIIFCYFTGIPGIINLSRTIKYWKKKEIVQGLIANIIAASILFIVLDFANAAEIKSNFFWGGIITAFAMPKAALISERIDSQKESDKE
tara:strand:- start:396 stop:752 length:357 start_codon:yes stop_codon:yes gene_type:complete